MLDGITPGIYIRLTHNGECVMSDTNMEKNTNRNSVQRHMEILLLVVLELE